jgi:methionine synthase I (cobalamin-dependent)/5,10-methylenetetrahydrofolate reductase
MTLSDLISDGRVHVLDGAIGTLLYERGLFVNVCYDELSVTRPELLRDVHAAYVEAGAEVIETNSFGANPVKLSPYGLDGRTEEINEAAARVALEAAGTKALVAGAMGPLGIRIEPWGPTSVDDATEHFRRQAQGLLYGGVHGFILETFADVAELECAFNAIRSLSDLPVLAHMTVGDDGRTPYGTTPEQLAAALSAIGPEVIGLNCSVGPAGILDSLEEMSDVYDGPLSAMPNAGVPRAVGDRKIYMASPEYMALYSRRLIAAGARFVGGCCGTTPEHIRAIRDHVAAVQPNRTAAVVARQIKETDAERLDPVPLAERSAWGRKLAEGEFLTAAEIVPAAGWDPGPMIAAAKQLAGAGVDALTVLDRPRGRSRMAVVPAASILSREVGVETIIHYTCRDRNMLGMISDLLGAAAAGINNLMLTSGDPSAIGQFPQSNAVFDIDSIGLTNVVTQLNRGLDPGGNPIGGAAKFVIGIVAKPSPVDAEREIERYHWKVEAGAEYAVTQPVFDAQELSRHLERTTRWPLPTVLGVYLAPSLRTLEFLGGEMPGIRVPERVMARMRAAQEKGAEYAEAEALAFAREVLDAVRDQVHGVYVAAPPGRIDLMKRFLIGLQEDA